MSVPRLSAFEFSGFGLRCVGLRSPLGQKADVCVRFVLQHVWRGSRARTPVAWACLGDTAPHGSISLAHTRHIYLSHTTHASRLRAIKPHEYTTYQSISVTLSRLWTVRAATSHMPLATHTGYVISLDLDLIGPWLKSHPYTTGRSSSKRSRQPRSAQLQQLPSPT